MNRQGAVVARPELDRLVTLIEVNRVLTAELDLQEILHRILQGAIQVLPAAETGALFFWDPERQALVVSHAIGLGPSVYDIVVQPGEALSGRAFLSRHAEIYTHKDSAAAQALTAGPANLEAFRAASGGVDHPQAAISAPLLYKGEALGAMVLQNLTRPAVFQPFDVQLLEGLAQAAAVAIMNARLYAGERSSRMRLEALNAEIRSQRDQLERRLQSQDALTEVVRDDLPLGALATRLARITHASVVLCDALGRVRATDGPSNPATLRELAPTTWPELEERLRRAALTRSQQRLEVALERELVIFPVQAGPETLGFVVLDARHRPLDDADYAAADSAALITAARLLRERALEEGETRRRGDLVERLLKGELPTRPEVLRQVQPPLRLVVGALRPITNGQLAATSDVLRAFLALTQEALAAEGRSVTVTVRDGYVVAIQSLARGPAGEFYLTDLEEAAKKVTALAPGWRAVYAVEEDVADLAKLGDVYQEAVLAIETRERLGPGGAAFKVRSLGAYRLILRAASGAEVVKLCQKTLDAVIQNDRGRGSSLLETFRVYLDTGASVKATARQLGVHPHTVQYRLDRLEELSGLSLRRAEERLTLELSLRILDSAQIL